MNDFHKIEIRKEITTKSNSFTNMGLGMSTEKDFINYLEKPDCNNTTALIKAIKLGNPKLVELVLSKRFTKIPDHAWEYAIVSENTEIMQKFIEKEVWNWIDGEPTVSRHGPLYIRPYLTDYLIEFNFDKLNYHIGYQKSDKHIYHVRKMRLAAMLRYCTPDFLTVIFEKYHPRNVNLTMMPFVGIPTTREVNILNYVSPGNAEIVSKYFQKKYTENDINDIPLNAILGFKPSREQLVEYLKKKVIVRSYDFSHLNMVIEKLTREEKLLIAEIAMEAKNKEVAKQIRMEIKE